MWWKVRQGEPEQYANTNVLVELIQTEDRFNEVKNAMKPLSKLDLDKLISSVRIIVFSSTTRLACLHPFY